ncbi:hypothetical protein ODJ79_44075 [Actinoplanes sp. KI2]|nr:hypothetical protein [Actinoplanes sp. KI2]MCU7730737.1 hypothetical protein [Actinoplanes sp. KI2]
MLAVVLRPVVPRPVPAVVVLRLGVVQLVLGVVLGLVAHRWAGGPGRW